MHPYLSHRNYLSQREMDKLAYQNGATDDGSFLVRWFNAAVRNWKRRKMIAALRAMDDRLLRDIGILRADIPRVAAGFSDRELGMVPVAVSTEHANDEDCVYLKAA